MHEALATTMDAVGQLAPQSPPVQGRLGDQLIERGLLTADQLDIAIREQKRQGGFLGEIISELGFVDEEVMAAVLAERSGFDRFDPATCMVDPEAVQLIPRDVANRCNAVPYSISGKLLHVAMVDPQDVLALDRLQRHVPNEYTILPRLCATDDFAELVDRTYSYALSIDGILKELDGDRNAVALSSNDATDDYRHPLVRLVDAVLFDAVKVGASDIHIEPEEYFLRVRYRIDGIMTQIRNFDKDLLSPISLRLKLMAEMDIADRLTAQDGRFQMRVGRRQIDFRVSSLPTVHGDNIVLRILDQSNKLLGLGQLGLSATNNDKIHKILKRPQGMIVATGPTGSGKTTTLYSMLAEISTAEINVMTLEDPVEYQLPLIRQTQVKDGVLDFSQGIRAMLRQDPDVVFIGEIRDEDTAQMALRAAMTGHRVFSTLHTNDSFGVLARLADLGLTAGLLAGNIIAVIAQRLARRLCDECSRPARATPDEMRILAMQGEPPEIRHPTGCAACNGMGYRGRVSVMEILVLNEALDELIMAEAQTSRIKALAREQGFHSIVDDAVERVIAGQISIDSMVACVDVTGRL